MASFRLRAKTFLLTYAQINDAAPSFFDRADAHWKFIQCLNGTPTRYRMGRELHEDGGVHCHVFISWEDPIRTRNQRIFDYAGTHPNIKTVRGTPEKAWDYAGKDDDIVYEHGSRPGTDGTSRTRRDDIFLSAFDQPTKEEFLEHIRKNAARDYSLYHGTLERLADKWYAPKEEQYRGPNFRLVNCENIIAATEELGLGSTTGERRKSLILWGPTRTGKTVYARSLGTIIPS